MAADSVVNWDSGHLTLPEVRSILAVLLDLCGGRLAGMDVVGDWSPVQTTGLFRRLFHWTMHPPLVIDPTMAGQCNAQVNRLLLGDVLTGTTGRRAPKAAELLRSPGILRRLQTPSLSRCPPTEPAVARPPGAATPRRAAGQAGRRPRSAVLLRLNSPAAVRR